MSDGGVLDEPLPDSTQRGSVSKQQSDAIVPLQMMIEETERVHIRKALTRCEGSVSKTAELLGISRKTLWEKMKRLSISV
jgi:DNA-binding NtrC family response regulator